MGDHLAGEKDGWVLAEGKLHVDMRVVKFIKSSEDFHRLCWKSNYKLDIVGGESQPV